MPRQTTRAKTVREEAPLIGNIPTPQLTAGRRFFSSQGSDRATREARALATAFDVGTDFISSQVDRNNRLGVERAVTSRGAGEDRDTEDQNAGFNIAWDELDAEADLNLIKKQLPQLLEEKDAENLSEKMVQAIITDAMKEMFEGIEPQSAYGAALAPGLLELEQVLLDVHRDQQLEKQQVEYRSKININLKARFQASVTTDNPNGTFPYEYLAEQTNTFFDGSNKKVAYWETIWDFAIRNGRPDIITGTPSRFPNQDPTGIDDPNMAPQHRAAIKSATVTAANIAKVKSDAHDAFLDDLRFDAQYAIYLARKDGMDVTPLLLQLKNIPGTEFSDIQSAKGFGDSQLDETESRSPDLSITSPLWRRIHTGQAGIEDIYVAWQNGVLGGGPQSEKLLDAMMSTARNVRSARARLGTSEVGVWRSTLNKRYNAQLGGLLTAINPVMHRINLDANAFYTDLVGSGTDPATAYNRTSDRFDPLVKNLPDIEESELTGRRSQTDFTAASVVTTSMLKDVASGKRTFADVFSGVNPRILSDRATEEWHAGNLTEDEAVELILQSL